MHQKRITLFLLLSLVLSSCVTLETLSSAFVGSHKRAHGPRVYSGTIRSISTMAMPGYLDHLFDRENSLLLLFDFPLSVALDTLLLPYTIPAQLIWGNLGEFWEGTQTSVLGGRDFEIEVHNPDRASQAVTVVAILDVYGRLSSPTTLNIELDANGDGRTIMKAPDKGRWITLSSEGQASHRISLEMVRRHETPSTAERVQ